MQGKLLKICLIGLLFIAIALIRVFENDLFYDPFIHFFKEQFSLKPPPEFELPKLLTNILFRYFLNTLLSIAILYVTFRKKEILRFTFWFFCIAFMTLITVYSILIINISTEVYQLFFNVRRLLIQPIFILLLLPAFYYQQTIKGKN